MTPLATHEPLVVSVDLLASVQDGSDEALHDVAAELVERVEPASPDPMLPAPARWGVRVVLRDGVERDAARFALRDGRFALVEADRLREKYGRRAFVAVVDLDDLELGAAEPCHGCDLEPAFGPECLCWHCGLLEQARECAQFILAASGEGEEPPGIDPLKLARRLVELR